MNNNTQKPILLSGIQPSGQLMIGNYVGALKNWVALQKDYDCLFMLADLHTITVKQDPKTIRERFYEFLALYLACGIDPQHHSVFVQSHVPEHAELAWVLNCYTYMGELNRMTQFKDKSTRHASNINAGLFDYPVLMAADILLYGSHVVPVGHDQKQHLELTRDLAIRFNKMYGNIFTVPKPYIPQSGGRLMALQDPTKKMSKSDDNANNYIALLDEPSVVRKKIKRAVTDSGSEVRLADDKPGVSNLLTLYAQITDKSIASLEKHYEGQGYGPFKADLADALVEFLTPLQKRYHAIRADLPALQTILKQGAEVAHERARTMLDTVHQAIGLIPR